MKHRQRSPIPFYFIIYFFINFCSSFSSYNRILFVTISKLEWRSLISFSNNSFFLLVNLFDWLSYCLQLFASLYIVLTLPLINLRFLNGAKTLSTLPRLHHTHEDYFYHDLVWLILLSHNILAYYLEDQQFLKFLKLKRHTPNHLTCPNITILFLIKPMNFNIARLKWTSFFILRNNQRFISMKNGL